MNWFVSISAPNIMGQYIFYLISFSTLGTAMSLIAVNGSE